MPLNDVKISIIVPIYNVEKELERCVQSIIGQTYDNIEILLVDDESPDNCPAICDEFAKKDERVHVIHKINGGLSDARNAGLMESTGDYILYVDSDDYIDLDTCERFVEVLKLSDTIDIIVGGAIVHKKDSSKLMVHDSIQSGKIYSANTFVKKAIASLEWHAPAWLNLYRRKFLIDNNLLYKKGIYFEDVEMLPRVFLKAEKIACMEGTFYHYVIRENSIMTTKNDQKKKADVIYIHNEWKKLIDEEKDKSLQKMLYGMLLKLYLYECRKYKISGWQISGMNILFAVQYGLNIKEKVKGVVFGLFPKLYLKL